MPVFRPLVWTYIIVSALAVTVWVGSTWGQALQHNPGAEYCDYDAPKKTHNYVYRNGDSCRIRAWLFIESGALIGAILIILHGPAYVYLLMSHLLRRQTLAKPARIRIITAPILAVAIPLVYLGYVFGTLWLTPENWKYDLWDYCRPAIGLLGEIAVSAHETCNISWIYVAHIFSIQFLAIALAILLPPALRPRLRAIRKTLMQT